MEAWTLKWGLFIVILNANGYVNENECSVLDDQLSPFLGDIFAFEIKRNGFWTYEYDKTYPENLSSRVRWRKVFIFNQIKEIT